MNDNELDYIPLHVRSCYSINDGLQNVGDIVKRAAKLGCPAIAVTDFNNMAGFVRFYNACYGAGIKPIAQVMLSNTELKVLVIDKILLLISGKAAEIKELIGQHTI